MQLNEAIRTLEKAGTAQTRKTWARHGIQPPMFGVNYSVLRPLAKKIGRDQGLAEGLWNTGNHDCRALASMIADPAKIKKSTLNQWAKTPGVRCLTGELARVVVETPWALELSAKWCASKQEIEQVSGWAVIAQLAMEDPASTDLDELFATCLDAIEENIHDAPNYTRYMMNAALIAIGGSNRRLKTRALAVAKKIGEVEVDHGDTDCKTPEAIPYINKMWARKKK